MARRINNAFFPTLEEKKPLKKKKGLLGKIKNAFRRQRRTTCHLVHICEVGKHLIWSGGILTLAHVDLPQQIPKQDLDPTFIGTPSSQMLQLLEFRRLRKVQ